MALNKKFLMSLALCAMLPMVSCDDDSDSSNNDNTPECSAEKPCADENKVCSDEGKCVDKPAGTPECSAEKPCADENKVCNDEGKCVDKPAQELKMDCDGKEDGSYCITASDANYGYVCYEGASVDQAPTKCEDETPFCLAVSGGQYTKCVQCLTNKDCGDDSKTCNPNTHECIAAAEANCPDVTFTGARCIDDETLVHCEAGVEDPAYRIHCPTSANVKFTGSACVSDEYGIGNCQCLTDDDCPDAERPVCNTEFFYCMEPQEVSVDDTLLTIDSFNSDGCPEYTKIDTVKSCTGEAGNNAIVTYNNGVIVTYNVNKKFFPSTVVLKADHTITIDNISSMKASKVIVTWKIMTTPTNYDDNYLKISDGKNEKIYKTTQAKVETDAEFSIDSSVDQIVISASDDKYIGIQSIKFYK